MTIQQTDMLSEDDFLEQAGVKGMKWGKRKSAKPTHTSADAARYNKISSRIKKNGLDNLSNDDLSKVNKRNQLLSEYKKTNPGKIKRGHEATKNALNVFKTVGAVVAAGTVIATNPMARKGAVAVVNALKNL